MTRVETALENAQDLNDLSNFSARFERFERFFFEKPFKPLKSCFKKPLKSRLFLAAVFERFLRQNLGGFLSGLPKKVIKTIKKPRKKQCDAKKQLNFFLQLEKNGRTCST